MSYGLNPKRKDMLPPCGTCPDKYPACSDSCEKPEYLQWRELLRKRKEASDKDGATRDAERTARKQRFRKK